MNLSKWGAAVTGVEAEAALGNAAEKACVEAAVEMGTGEGVEEDGEAVASLWEAAGEAEAEAVGS